MATQDSTTNPSMKRCSLGEQCKHPKSNKGWLLRTPEFFHKTRKALDGFHNRCKICNGIGSKKWRENHSQEVADYQSAYRATQGEQRLADKRAYHDTHREEDNQRCLTYYWSDPETQRAKKRQSYQKHPERAKRNRDLRKARKLELPFDYTHEDWQYTLEYWRGVCCICGRKPEGRLVLAKEHWIAMTDLREDNPGTVSHNILPMCHVHKGAGGCNNRKRNLDPIYWLEKEFDEPTRNAIIARIEAFFATVRVVNTDDYT